MTSVLQHLRQRSDDQLRRLFQLRPDLGLPAVTDFSALATRASTQVSVQRALDALSVPQLQVLNTLAVAQSRRLGEQSQAISTGSVASLLAHDTDPAAVDTVLAELDEQLLVLDSAGGEHGWTLPATVQRGLGPYPAELGRPATQLGAVNPATTRADIDRRLAEHADLGSDDACEQIHRGLEVLAHAPLTRVNHDPGLTIRVLLDTGLLVNTEPGYAEMPQETGLALRGGTVATTFSTEPPAAEGSAVLGLLVNNAAAAAVADLLRNVGTLLDTLWRGRDTGIDTLRSGGVGVRDVNQLARRLGAEAEETLWLLEITAAAGVLGLNPDTSRWEPQLTIAQWHDLTRPRQWQLLAAGWLSSTRAPWIAPLEAPAQSNAAHRTVPSAGRALAPDRNRADAPRLRHTVLRIARQLDDASPGHAVTEQVETRRRWARPRAAQRTRAFTAPLIDEATRLGLFGAGALTRLGRTLAVDAAQGLPEATEHVEALLPAAVTTVRLQADLTAVATGYLDPQLAGALSQIADDEGDGAAAIFRFSEASLRRGLDAGLSTASILELLTSHSQDEVPQSLRYLVEDTARRHGALSVSSAASVLTALDPDALEALLADPQLAEARLQRIAPTVAISSLDDAELQMMLNDAGHPAARPHSPGSVRSPRSPRAARPTSSTRLTSPHSAPATPPVTTRRQELTDEDISTQIDRLRSAVVSRPVGDGPEDLITTLTQAAQQRSTLRVTAADRTGAHRRYTLVPRTVADGRLRGTDPDQETDIALPLHRIVAADPVPAGSKETPEP